MKKKKLLIMFIVLLTTPVTAQHIEKQYDDAIRGAGLYQFNYVGAGWVNATNTADPYFANTVSYSNQKDNYVTFNFAGDIFQLYGAKAPHHGIAGVSIDNGTEVKVDMYAATRMNLVPIYGTQLPQGYHTVKIRVTGTKNAAATNTYLIVDYVSTAYKSSYGSGLFALNSDLRGMMNTAVGVHALTSDVEGVNNTAVGYGSLFSNVATVGPYATGVYNTAVGASSLYYNQGAFNTAVGTEAMQNNVSGKWCSAFGVHALQHNAGNGNTAIGLNALQNNTSGNDNVAVGNGSLGLNGPGNGNVAVGTMALASNQGNNNTAIGYSTGSPYMNGLENTTAIGYGSLATASNQMRFGNTSVTSIGGQVSWSTLSDGRFKKDIKEDVSGLEFIEKLRPVSYTVDKDAVNKFLRIPDSLRNESAASRKKVIRQTGFVAQEVEDVVKKTGYVFSGVEAPQTENEHYSIRYAEFVVPLVKAMQELSATVKDQKTKIELLTQQLDALGGASNDKIISNSETILYQNNPNPFSVDTEIKMALSENTVNAVVMVYNLEGKQLKSVAVQGRGNASVKIAGSELNAGMYLYALIVDGKVVDTKRMILTK